MGVNKETKSYTAVWCHPKCRDTTFQGVGGQAQRGRAQFSMSDAAAKPFTPSTKAGALSGVVAMVAQPSHVQRGRRKKKGQREDGWMVEGEQSGGDTKGLHASTLSL